MKRDAGWPPAKPGAALVLLLAITACRDPSKGGATMPTVAPMGRPTVMWNTPPMAPRTFPSRTAYREGVVLAQTAVSMANGVTINGRLLAQTAITLDGNTVVAPAP